MAMSSKTSFPEFGDTTTATEVCEVFSSQIHKKKILLVGVGPESLGEAIAISIAKHNPGQLILASRTPSKIDEVISKLKGIDPEINVASVTVDLSNQESIRKAAVEIAKLTEKLDIVINNAAVNVQDHILNNDGIEMHFATNHVGLFLLTNLLLPQIRKAATESSIPGSTRIVNVTSEGHRLSPIRFSDYNMQKMSSELPVEERPPPRLPPSIAPVDSPYTTFLAYGQSKTANILFSVSLTKALEKDNISSYSAHPGSIWTNLPRNLNEKSQEILRTTGHKWKSQDEGAATIAVAAFDPALNVFNGPYLSGCQYSTATEYATDEKIAERLWELSEKLVGEKFNLAEK